MQWILATLIVSMVLVALVVYFDDGEDDSSDEDKYRDIVRHKSARGRIKEKESNLSRILVHLEKYDEVSNSDIGSLLGVSESTVTRYFDELEARGEVRQIGDVGRGVVYKKIHR